MKRLIPFGFDTYFQEHLKRDKLTQYQPARVSAVDRESFQLINAQGERRAEITGRLMYNAASPLDYPTTGDWVYARYLEGEDFAIIDELLPRKSLLKRKTAGRKIAYQLVAANIDTAFVMQSLDQNFNLRRMERYLVMAHEGQVQPVVLLSKSDLISPARVARRVTRVRQLMPDVQVTAFSNTDRSGVDAVQAYLVAGKTYCLLGSSGVGKTTLLNNLLGGDDLKTRNVRGKDNKGRHTTTRRQLIILDSGALLIDTPGMRELGHIGAETGLTDTFDELSQLTAQCQFADCSHTQEPGCALLAALEGGTIAAERYHSFLKMTKEAAHHQRSYLEKRHRDRQFGKMVKAVMKHKKM